MDAQEVIAVEETENNDNATLPEIVKPTFIDKAKIVIENILDKIYKIRCVCCFTSLLAVVGLVFLFGEQMQVPDFVGYILAILWLIGVLSGIIACPLKMIGNVVGLVVGGVVIGLPFLGVGAIVGLVIALFICFGMVLFFPSIVTIRYYFNELRYKR